MFLNYNRSTAKYIFLWIITGGLYNVFFRRAAVRDFNTACGEKRAELPGFKYALLYYLTLGIYNIFWDCKFIALCQEYITQSGSDFVADADTYRFIGAIPFVRLAVLSGFIKPINEFCKIYSDKQLAELEESEDELLSVNRVREVDINDLDSIYAPSDQEKPAPVIDIAPKKEVVDDGNVHKIAGFAVIEEYDPENDQKRIAYRLQMEREARERAREEAKRPKAPEPEKVVTETVLPEKYRRNTSWFIKVFAALMAVFILPLVIIATVIFVLPPVYDDSFVGVLGDKYDHLNEVNRPKIIVIGGSSVAFGLDSWMIENELEYDVVNFGLYADLGTKLMMDLSKSNINEGDIIVLAPEMNAQTLSLYFNGDTTLQAIDGKPEMLLHISPDDYGSLIGSSLKYAMNKLGFIISGEKPDTGRPAYQKEYFNEYGDNTYNRPYNEMTGIQNVITLDFHAKMNDNNVTEYEEYIEYVNKYVHYAERKGAKVYFSFCPMNEAAMSSENNEDSIEDFYENLCKVLECRVISNVYDYILDEGYFYDSEFHLNNAGVTVRTARLIDDIKRELEITTRTNYYDFMSGERINAIPAPTGFIDPNESLFVYEEREEGGEIYYVICGLSEAGKKVESLTVASKHDGRPVKGIAADAFKESTVLKNVYISESITKIASYAFRGSTVTGIYMPESVSPSAITVPAKKDGLFIDGARSDIRIYVPNNLLSYLESVSWADYADYIENAKADENEKYFTYELITLGDVKIYAITGLSDEGKTMTTLTIPDFHLGKAVARINPDAFKGSTVLKTLYLGNNINNIQGKAFNGSSITAVYIPDGKKVDSITVPNNMGGSLATEGCQPDLKIYVPKGEFNAFIGDYFWGDYGSFIVEKP